MPPKVEFAVIIGDEALRVAWFQDFVPKDAFTHYCWLETHFLVKRNHGPPVEGTASFHTTRWTIVMRAAQSQARGGESALAELCQPYAYPLSIFARRRGYSPEDAQDLTQGVFLQSEDGVFGGVGPLNCKFRSILLVSLRRHAPVWANDRIAPFAHDGLASRLKLSIGGASL